MSLSDKIRYRKGIGYIMFNYDVKESIKKLKDKLSPYLVKYQLKMIDEIFG